MKLNPLQKIFLIMGIGYIALGSAIFFTFLAVGTITMALIPLLFMVAGAVFVAVVLYGLHKKKNIIRHGTKYPAKIYGYVENTSYTVNGNFTMNVKARYFDKNHVEREAILPTSFTQGSSQYPIGMTIDIYEYRGEFGFDELSVRNEVLPGEPELMDDKLMDPSKVKMVAIVCPNCGASFQAAKGYSNKCPYCESYYNA